MSDLQTSYADMRILNVPKNLLRQKISKPLIVWLDKRNFAKPHISVPFNLHVYINQLTNNTNSDSITEKDRPMTSNDADRLEFEDNIENTKKKKETIYFVPTKNGKSPQKN